jgi:hypothetical protein
MISRLIARIFVAEIAVLLAIFALTAPAHARTNPKLRGIVTLDSPVAAGSIFIFNGSDMLQAEPNVPFANGTFEINLNSKVAALLPNTDLHVLVDVQGPDAPAGGSSPLTLSAVLHDFDPDSQVVFINPVTTVVSTYLDDNPDLTLEEAANKVEGVLGVATDTTFQSTHMLDFDSKAFVAASRARGGFDAYVQAVARLADKGEVVNYAKGPAVTQATSSNALNSARKKGTKGAEADTDFLHLVTALGRGIAKDAFANSNTAGELGGWIIETISGKLTPSQEDQLDKVSKQLDKISTQIGELGNQIKKQVDDLKDTVKAAQNYIVYQQVALATIPAVVSLDGMRKRLFFLAQAGAAGESHPDLAADLSRDIFSKASDDLESIQNDLAGINQTPGLISQWTKVMLDENPNLRVPFPVFFTNDYLTSATTQYQFYLGAQFTGFDLRIEYAHTLIKTGPVLAKQIIKDAIDSFNSNFNTNMKLIPANSHASIGGQNYYPSIALPANDLVADSRSGLVWLNHAPCSTPNQSQPCNFALRQNARGNLGYPLANEFLKDFSDGGVKFSLPSTDNWNRLVAPLQLTNADYLGWLNQRGFRLGGQLDSAFPDEPGPPYTNSYWTSDSVSLKPPSVLYPDTINWFFDVKRQGNQLFVLFVTPPGLELHLFPPPAARILPRAFDLNLLYREDPTVLGRPEPPQ